MKQFSALFLVLILFGCDGLLDDSSHYSIRVTKTKAYPVFLDMSEIGNIQVKANSTLVAPFKILSNDKYFFVGDRMKGLHVYEKKARGVGYLCFIECLYINDFEISGNLLFCNNLVDMVVVDVSNPLQISILHRQKNHFNRFKDYKDYWNLPYTEGKGLIAKTENHALTGVVTDKQPDLDFTEFDQQNANLTTKVIPYTWFNNHLESDAPYPGMIKMGADEIYTYGSYNSWSICSFKSGIFSVREEDLWSDPRGNYAPPYYYSNAYPERMFFEDDLIFIMGTDNNHSSGYCDCIPYVEKFPYFHALYFPTFQPLDICYMPSMNTFFALSSSSIWGVLLSGDVVTGFKKTYKDYQIASDAVEISRVGDQLITLGKELSVYSVSENEIRLVKKYPGIAGKCCKKEGSLLTVANTQGLLLYDITDLENIQLIQ